MSVDYAAGLSEFDDLGVCGLEEIIEDLESVRAKVKTLAGLLISFGGSTVVHTGAGISTSSGIPDFRGKSGVWTKLLESRQSCSKETSPQAKPEFKREVKLDNIEQVVVKVEQRAEETSGSNCSSVVSFDTAKPTTTHMVLKELCSRNLVNHIISQNVDGLFLKSNLPRSYISELHGNFFLDECGVCNARYIRSEPSKTMRLTKSSDRCPRERCRGFIRDCILDWHSKIPHLELRRSQKASKLLLHILIGSTAQLVPAKTLINSSKRGKRYKLVVINLQPTQFDNEADLVINYYADDVMRLLAEELKFPVPAYDLSEDPTKCYAGTEWKRT